MINENWEDFMTRNQAVAYAEQLADKGMKHAEIGLKLAEGGYKSQRTGNALGATGVSQMLKKKKRRQSRTPPRFTRGEFRPPQGHSVPRRCREVDPKAQWHGCIREGGFGVAGFRLSKNARYTE